MTVRLIAIATLMSTFITESMCLVRIQLLKVCSPLLNTTFSLAEIKALWLDGWFLPERAAFLLTANSVVLWILWSRTLKEFLKPKSDWHFHSSLPTTNPVVGALRNNIPAGLSFHDRSFLARHWVLLLFQTMLDQIELFNFSTILEKKRVEEKILF